MAEASKVCRKLWRICIQPLHRILFLHLGNSNPCYVTVFESLKERVADFSRHLSLIVQQDDRGQIYFTKLMACLHKTPLESFIFDEGKTRRRLKPTAPNYVVQDEQQMMVSTLSESSGRILYKMLNSSEYATFRSNLTNITIPLYDYMKVIECAERSKDPDRSLHLLDSNIIIGFDAPETKLHPARPVKVVARGYPKTVNVLANGTPIDAVQGFLDDSGITSDIRDLTLGGVHMKRLDDVL